MMDIYVARYATEPGYNALLELARSNAYALDGWMGDQREDVMWASCDEECPECEFADECEFGKCECPAGYNTHWDG